MKKRRQKAKPRAASNSGKYDAADATDATDVSTESEELKGKELLNGDLESEEKDKDVGSDKRNTSFTNVTISLESNDDTSSSSSSSSSSACCSSSSSSSVTKSISPQKTTTSSSSSYLLIELKLICMDLSCVKYNELTHKYLCIDANGSLLSHIEKFILSKMGIAESLFEVVFIYNGHEFELTCPLTYIKNKFFKDKEITTLNFAIVERKFKLPSSPSVLSTSSAIIGSGNSSGNNNCTTSSL